jgi:CBS domain containing-hemolysin-like protein
MTGLLLALAFLMLCSMFFSATEIAITMASRVRLRTRAERGSAGARRAERLLVRPERGIVTCLVGNTLVNAALAAYGRGALLRLHPAAETTADLLSTAILVPLVLVFCETLPKALAQTYPNRTLAALALPLILVRLLVWPLTQVAIRFADAVRRLAGMKTDLLDFLSREELKQFVARSEKHGHVDAEERDLIYRIFEFWRLEPARFLRRLQDVPRLPADATVGQAQEFMRERRLVRLVVTDPTDRDVVGIATAPALLTAPPGAMVDEFLQPPVRAQLSQSVDRLFAALQRSPSQIAVLGDGDATGIVLLDDLLQELLGRDAGSAPAAAAVPWRAPS